MHIFRGALAHVSGRVSVRNGSRLLLVAVGASLILTGCPQLANDDFREAAVGFHVGSDASTPGSENRDAGLTGPYERDPLDASALGVDAAASSKVSDSLRAALVHRYDLGGSGTDV